MSLALTILNFLIPIVSQLGPAVMNLIQQLDPSHPAVAHLASAAQSLSAAQGHLTNAHLAVASTTKS